MPRSIRSQIEAAGGLVNAADLARAWGLSRTRLTQLQSEPDFPEPVAHVGRHPVWLARDAERWRARRQEPAAQAPPRTT